MAQRRPHTSEHPNLSRRPYHSLDIHSATTLENRRARLARTAPGVHTETPTGAGFQKDFRQRCTYTMRL